MKALVYERYGPPEEVLTLQDVGMPQVEDDEVLVRVRASSVAGDDWHLLRGRPNVARLATGLGRPKHRIPGQDVAGQVEAIGPRVTRFRTGDEVFGWCRGAYAEYVAVSPQALAPSPANLTLAQAAAVPVCGFTALQALRDKGRVRPGQQVLVNGAAGGVGTFAVQLAKALGAAVTGVCSTRNAALVRALGAQHVVDYTREDFTRGGRRYDLIVDLIGNRSLSACRRALTPEGTLVLVGGRGGRWLGGQARSLRALALSPFVRQRLRPLIHTDNQEDLVRLRTLIEAGQVTPVVDRSCPLSEVPQAMRAFEAWHSRGKVVVTV